MSWDFGATRWEFTATLRESAATGWEFKATGQEFSAKAQQFMAQPWKLPAMLGESVAAGWDLTATLRDSAAASGTARQWLGNARQAVRIPWRGSGNSARGAGNLRPHSGRRFRNWGNGRGPFRQHEDMVPQVRPCVPGEILSKDTTSSCTGHHDGNPGKDSHYLYCQKFCRIW